MSRTLLLGLAAAAMPALSAAAAPATPEEAARLAALFERYVGHPAPGQPPAVTVAPKGDAYVATLDTKRALAGLSGFGVTIEAAPSATTLQPLPDGTWRVTSTDSPPITLHIGPPAITSSSVTGADGATVKERGGSQTITLSSATSAFDGIYDPKLYGFSHSRQDQTGYDYKQTTPTSVQDRRAEKVGLVLDGVAAQGGGVDTKARYDVAGQTGTMTIGPLGTPADPATPAPSPSFSYASPAVTATVGLDGLRTKAVLDLWAFLVAHPSRDSLAAAQDEFKAMLHAGLPYLGALKEDGSLASITATTPIGPASAASLGFHLDVGGLSNHGTGELGFSFADLKIPSGQLPPWMSGLVPTSLDIHLGLDGFNANAAASAAVDAFDLRQPVVFAPAKQAAVFKVLWPGDGTLTMKPSRIGTGVLDLKMDGRVTLGAQPNGRFTVTGTGLEKEIAALQAGAAGDPSIGQVLGPLVLAKNLAKPGPDGGLLWVIDLAPGGVSVNGAPLQ